MRISNTYCNNLNLNRGGTIITHTLITDQDRTGVAIQHSATSNASHPCMYYLVIALMTVCCCAVAVAAAAASVCRCRRIS
jgi:hypothetical protein